MRMFAPSLFPVAGFLVFLSCAVAQSTGVSPIPQQPATAVSGGVPERPKPAKSPEVAADRSVTFRYRDAAAKQVSVLVEGVAEAMPMQRGEGGLWTLTTGPIEPQIYGYHFEVDGERVLDPRNADIRPNLLSPTTVVHVPGAVPQPWEWADVPHGAVTHHRYVSKLATDEPLPHARDLYVYTPPGYDAKRKQPYPVLYLLHGFSDGADGWTAAGQADLILDNLLAQGKVEPMVVVMPRAYGTMRVLTAERGGAAADAAARLSLENQQVFTEMLLKEVLPMVEARYDVARDAPHRAIAGLSMGGGHSIATGLNHPEVFGWVGAFSSGLQLPRPAGQPASGTMDAAANQQAFAMLIPHAATQPPVQMFYITCGTEDRLIGMTRQFGAWAKTNVKGKVVVTETPGMHTWMVWRGNLITFSQLLWK